MPRTRRATIRFRRLAASAAGLAFLARVREAVGDPFVVVRGERTPERIDAFTVRGPLGDGHLFETPRVPTTDGLTVAFNDFVQRRWTLDGSGLWRLRVATHRPDPRRYARAGIDAPPAASRSWWREEARRVGDLLDVLTETFEPDDEPVPLGLEDGLMVRRTFGCSMCDKPAARVTFLPVGHEAPDEALIDDVLRPRIVVNYGRNHGMWLATDADEDRYEDARAAIARGDAVLLARCDLQWTPFFCTECERSYCRRHWNDDLCPYGHARAPNIWGL